MSVSLYVRQDIGKGNPIVLLHGIFADGTQWQKIAKLLKKDYRVIVVDVLGHGRSPRPADATYGPDEHATALRNALEKIHATKNLTVVGYSMGGAVALSYCAKYPEDIEQLYLISTPFYLKPDQMVASRYAGSLLLTKVSQASFRVIEKLLDTNKSTQKIVARADRSKLFHKMIGATDNTLDTKVMNLCIKNMINEFDFAGHLSNITAPTTFYAGKKDPFIVQGQLYALKRFSPYLDIHRLDVIKIDHMLVQNLPKEIVKLITKNRERLLHVRDDKGSGEVLALLHGIESSASYWQNLVPALAEHRRVITIDLLGFGRSPKPKNIAYSLEDQVLWLDRTLETLQVSKITLAGHSLGSLVALAYAAKHPQKVSSVTLFSPVLLPENVKAQKISVRVLQQLNLVPDSSYLYAQAAQALGDDKLSDYLPGTRSVENAINLQRCIILAGKAAKVRAHFYYGTYDPLVDAPFVEMVAKEFKHATVTALPHKNHNFPIFAPNIALQVLDGNKPHRHKPKRTSIIPPTFMQQISRLAVPALLSKSALYCLAGVLLFTPLAPTLLTVGLACFVLYQGYKILRGAFSLRYEGLSYASYIGLGLFAMFMGFVLYKEPALSLKIAVFTICSLAVAVGLARVTVALAWTKSSRLKRSLLLTGVPMILLGAASIFGSVKSVYIIVYAIAIWLIVTGIMFWWYSMGALIMAYIRGYNSR
ncbi:MAG: alpha/beta fold hydrolase [Candidatus Saccharimonadales bacterium]